MKKNYTLLINTELLLLTVGSPNKPNTHSPPTNMTKIITLFNGSSIYSVSLKQLV